MTTAHEDLTRLREFIDTAGDACRTRSDISAGLFGGNRTALQLDNMLAELVRRGDYEETTRRAAVGRPTLLYRRTNTTTERNTTMTEETTAAPPRYKVVQAAVSRMVDGKFTVHRHGTIVELTAVEAERHLKLGSVALVDAGTPLAGPAEPTHDLPEWLGPLDDLPKWRPTEDEAELGMEAADSLCWMFNERASRIERTPDTLKKLQAERQNVATSTVYARGKGAINADISHVTAQRPFDIAAARDLAAQIVARVKAGDIGSGNHGVPGSIGIGSTPTASAVLIAAAERRYTSWATRPAPPRNQQELIQRFTGDDAA